MAYFLSIATLEVTSSDRNMDNAFYLESDCGCAEWVDDFLVGKEFIWNVSESKLNELIILFHGLGVVGGVVYVDDARFSERRVLFIDLIKVIGNI